MNRLEMRNYNMIFIGKRLKYKLYHQVKFINMSILPRNQQQIIEQAKFTYSPLGKAFEKQTKTIDALKAIEHGSNNKCTITKESYDDILEERMDEILTMGRETDYKLSLWL